MHCCDPSKVLEITRQMVTHARSHVEDVEFSAEDALRSDYNFLSEVTVSELMNIYYNCRCPRFGVRGRGMHSGYKGRFFLFVWYNSVSLLSFVCFTFFGR